MSLKNIIRRTAELFAWFASAVLILIMALTFVDVVGRTLFGRSLVGTVESVELLMGVLVFCGLALTEVNRRHVFVETFQQLFPSPLQRISRVFNLLLALAVTGVLAWQLMQKTKELISDQEYTQILEIPYWPGAVLMSLGIFLFLLVLLLHLVEELWSSKTSGQNLGD